MLDNKDWLRRNVGRKLPNLTFRLTFDLCPQVDVNDYMVRCRAAYCTSLDAASEVEAHKAVCNVLSAYHKICTGITGKAVLWRSASLCREFKVQSSKFNPVFVTTRDVRVDPKLGQIGPKNGTNLGLLKIRFQYIRTNYDTSHTQRC